MLLLHCLFTGSSTREARSDFFLDWSADGTDRVDTDGFFH